MAQGTLLNVMWQPGWEGSVGKNGYVCTPPVDQVLSELFTMTHPSRVALHVMIQLH